MKDGLSVDDMDKIAVSENSVWILPMVGVELNRYDKATGTWEIIKQPDRHDEHERLRALAVDGAEVGLHPDILSPVIMKKQRNGRNSILQMALQVEEQTG